MLPIHAIRADFEAALDEGPVVVSSPTGSGKSTEIPRWAMRRKGRVLVVEPRRVACQSLAVRVAELEGTPLGSTVGYSVRDDAVTSDATRILFATPGIVLRARSLVESFDVVVLDEFHERSLDLDLLLALFAKGRGPRLVVMSATIEGDRVASHVGGRHLEASGRTHPVDVRYLESGSPLPDPSDIVPRVTRAVAAAASDPGDILVFLPGKAEIEACARALRGGPDELLPLHGGLSLAEQRRPFEPSTRRRVILATNVAETSITLPNVGVVIDTGLVRQTRYHEGRAFLSLVPIAEDSAAQRAGRAGRTGPGIAYRLFSRAAKLAKTTPPEVHRESLVPLVLSAAMWGERVEALPLLDPPKAYALESAREELVALGALDAGGRATERGKELHGLPLDAPLARLLVEARDTGALEDAIDLVSVLSVGRPLFVGTGSDDSTLREGDCDASALVRTLRASNGTEPFVSPFVLAEARRIRARLRRAHGLAETGADAASAELDRDRLLRTAIAADPRSVHVARVRGRQIAFSNGGTELELARESRVRNARDLEAIVVFESRALGSGQDARILVTCASPVSLAAILRAGLGRDRLEGVSLEKKKVVARIERVYAKRVLGTREEVPTGALAREAIATLFLRGSLFRESLATTKERLALVGLASRLGKDVLGEEPPPAPPSLEDFVLGRLLVLGIESGEDLELLSPKDLLAPDLPFHLRTTIERDYPRTVSVGDATYEADYDLEKRMDTLSLVRGQRKEPPPLAYLPRFEGFGITVVGPRGATVLRRR